MKKLFSIILFFVCTQAFSQTVNDFQIPSRGNGGKVIFAPKDANGNQVQVLTIDPVNGVSGSGIQAKNHFHNGNFTHWQRGTASVGTGPATLTSGNSGTLGGYLADRTKVYEDLATGVGTQERSTDVPSGLAFPASASLKVTVTMPQASVGASEVGLINQWVEGYDLLPLYNKTMTLSFWVKSSLTGTYNISFQNNVQNKSLVKHYTISSANTWEKKTITFAHDASGTWSYDTTRGLQIGWILACGTNYADGIDGTWVSSGGEFCSATTQGTNLFATNGNTFYLAQIMLNEGSVAAPFQLSGGTVGGELRIVQRFYQQIGGVNNSTGIPMCYGKGVGTTSMYIFCPLPVTLRTTAPTVNWFASTSFCGIQTNDGTCDNVSGGSVSATGYNHGVFLNISSVSGIAAGYPYLLDLADAGIRFHADF